MFAKVNAEPLIFSTDKDGTYDISSPVPSIRAFHLPRTFLAHEQEEQKKSVVQMRMSEGVKNRQTYEAYCPRYGKANYRQVSIWSTKNLNETN